MIKRRPQRKKIKPAIAPRFGDCVECRFYKPGNTASGCAGCTAGENFEATVEELDPYADRFLSRRSDNS